MQAGITPARAGKRAGTRITRRPSGDHPRACGEKRGVLKIHRRCKGSPPRVRGKAYSHLYPNKEAGITPARAGKRNWESAAAVRSGDHPRACGEKPSKLNMRVRFSGSPPRVRGKDGKTTGFRSHLGITPARAGKSPCAPCSRVWSWDHPRACGEKADVLPLNYTGTGSPPRVRGKAL